MKFDIVIFFLTIAARRSTILNSQGGFGMELVPMLVLIAVASMPLAYLRGVTVEDLRRLSEWLEAFKVLFVSVVTFVAFVVFCIKYLGKDW